MANVKKQKAPRPVADLTPDELARRRQQVIEDMQPMACIETSKLGRKQNAHQIAEYIQPYAPGITKLGRKQKAPRLVADLTPEELADPLTQTALQRRKWVGAYDGLPVLDAARVAEILAAIDHSSLLHKTLASSKNPRDLIILCLQARGRTWMASVGFT